MTKVRNRPTEEGRQLGAKMAQFCDESEPAARLKVPGKVPQLTLAAQFGVKRGTIEYWHRKVA